MKIRSLPYLFTTIFLYSILTGCSTTQLPQFYMLSSLEDIKNNMPSTRPITGKHIGLGPIHFPEYLDRSAIVIRHAGSEEVTISETHRWAESLEKNFTQVVANNLQGLLKNHNITTLPWHNAKSIDYQIIIDVYRFDADTHNNIMLSAQWAVHRKIDKRILYIGKSMITEKAENNTYATLIRAQNKAAQALSNEIASLIEKKIEVTSD